MAVSVRGNDLNGRSTPPNGTPSRYLTITWYTTLMHVHVAVVPIALGTATTKHTTTSDALFPNSVVYTSPSADGTNLGCDVDITLLNPVLWSGSI